MEEKNNILRTIEEEVSAELVEKKSKFIATIFPVQKEEEIEEKIKKIKSKYYDARHNCFAFSFQQEDRKIERCSDDGEPSGTAGAPLLNIIQKNELSNVVIVVTRYFGGILLGTGGLVRAYTGAAMLAIEKAKIVTEIPGEMLEIQIPYAEQEKFVYYCHKNGINIIKIEYGEVIKCILEADEKEKQFIINKHENNKFIVLDYTIKEKKNIRKNIEI